MDWWKRRQAMSEQSLKPGWKWVKFADVIINSTKATKDYEADGFTRYIIGKHIPQDGRITEWNPVGDGEFGLRIRTKVSAGDVICTTRGLNFGLPLPSSTVSLLTPTLFSARRTRLPFCRASSRPSPVLMTFRNIFDEIFEVRQICLSTGLTLPTMNSPCRRWMSSVRDRHVPKKSPRQTVWLYLLSVPL